MIDNVRDAINGGALDPWPTMTGFLILGALVDLLVVVAALVWPRRETCPLCHEPNRGVHDWCDAEMRMIMNAEAGDDDA